MEIPAPIWAIIEPHLFGGVLLMTRLIGLVQLMPAISQGMESIPTKTLFITMLTVFCYSALGMPVVFVPNEILVAIPMLVREFLIGASLGYVVHLLFAVAEGAGAIAAMSMSLSLGGLVDPMTGEQSPAIGNLLGIGAALLFVALGGHREMVQGLMTNLHLYPVGGSTPVGLDVAALSALGKGFFAASIQLAAPVLVVTTLVNVGLGLLARAAPQVNLFAVGFALLLVAGLIVLDTTVMALHEHVEGDVSRLGETMNEHVRELGP